MFKPVSQINFRLRQTEFFGIAAALLAFTIGLFKLQGALAVDGDKNLLGVWLPVFTLFYLAPFGVWLLLTLRQSYANQLLLPISVALGCAGLLQLARLGTLVLQENGTALFDVNNLNLLEKQVQFWLIGFGLIGACNLWPNLLHHLKDNRRWLFLVGCILLGLTAAFGVESAGAGSPRVSLKLPGLSSFQPVELMKLLYVIFLAAYFADARQMLSGVSWRMRAFPIPNLRALIPALVTLLMALVLLLWMGDLGAALILIGVLPVMLAISMPRNLFLAVLGITVLLLVVALGLVTNPLKNVVGERISDSVTKVQGRLIQSADPWKVCTDSACPSYQLLQGLYAVASGGWFGTGVGQGDIVMIPLVQSDFAYAGWVEEWGSLGGWLLLLGYGAWLWQAGQIAILQETKGNRFPQLLTVGIATWFCLQVFIILGGTLKLIPFTGITVPFLSAGGMSIVINCMLIGLLLVISDQPTIQDQSVSTFSALRVLPVIQAASMVFLGFVTLYWAVFESDRLLPTYPVGNGDKYTNNIVARSRYNARIAKITRGDILSADGEKLVVTTGAGRSYSQGAVIPVVGLVDGGGFGASGIESRYNAELLGKDAPFWSETWWEQQTATRWTGNNVQLTLDMRWQQAAMQAIYGYKGAIVVLDARSGGILAMLSNPYPDADTVTFENIGINNATQGQYPPGSTFKTVIGALAFENKLAKPDTAYPFPENEWYFSNGLWCHNGEYGDYSLPSCNTEQVLNPMSFTQAFSWSDNVVFANLATRLGAQAVNDGAAHFGIGAFPEKVSFDFDWEVASVAQDALNLNSPQQLAMTGIGQSEVKVTPLHMALVAAAIANEGKLPLPYLKQRFVSTDGKVFGETKPRVWQQAVSTAAAKEMRQVMVAGMSDGWPSAAAVPALVEKNAMGGKTGTAENNDSVPHSWFIGFADLPEGDGKTRLVAFAILVENAGEGSQVAAPMAQQMLNTMLGQ